MLVCIIYILVGMALTTTIIELVRCPHRGRIHRRRKCSFISGGSMQTAGGRCRS
jgi:hypothetical protein